MTIYTKSIYKLPSDEDGVRISVMSRHTLSDGRTPDLAIMPWHEHLKKLSPAEKDVGAFYRHELERQELLRRYREHLQEPDISLEVQKLAKRALQDDITILCVEENAADCHRGVLAEECKKYEPSLQVVHV